MKFIYKDFIKKVRDDACMYEDMYKPDLYSASECRSVWRFFEKKDGSVDFWLEEYIKVRLLLFLEDYAPAVERLEKAMGKYVIGYFIRPYKLCQQLEYIDGLFQFLETGGYEFSAETITQCHLYYQRAKMIDKKLNEDVTICFSDYKNFILEGDLKYLRIQKLDSAIKNMLRRDADKDETCGLKKADLNDVRRFAVPLLDVVDNLERALDVEHGNEKALRDGIELTLAAWEKATSAVGIKRIHALGHVFNPHLHEALSMSPSDQPENIVTVEHAAGYTLEDSLLRAAKVVISSGST